MKIILTFFIPPLSLNNSDIKTYFGSTIHEPSPRAPLQEKEDALKPQVVVVQHSGCERFDDGVCIDRGRCDSSEFLDGGVQDASLHRLVVQIRGSWFNDSSPLVAFGGASMEGLLAASGSATFKLLGNVCGLDWRLVVNDSTPLTAFGGSWFFAAFVRFKLLVVHRWK
ncbi:hypothetical protein L2E82_45024 [Cichorium intybus]|uniref:Uncharacterized protein n=1 Tax=Cichorium intybus TaxID=13427 RepID=A0ACB8ZT71_CICIN|nr:hypothetical protein L2E82_45024 [Cichorium intybus]